MTTRILPREEWGKLAGTDAEPAIPLLTDQSRVVVVEHEGTVVGCHLLGWVLHAECLWIHPDHRQCASVARRLWQAVKGTIREEFGARGFVTAADDDTVRGLLAHVGAVALPDHFAVHIGER